MKVKTSITLSEELLETVDELSVKYKNRSEFLEIIIRKAIAQMIRDEQNERDLRIINEHADRLNQEAEDVLAYQLIP
jgi:metal-responsive CopG/Arc/MetJ family transcriptional regulator